MTVENERKVYAMHKNIGKEPQLAKMMVENASNVGEMHRKGRNQLECPMMTVDSEKDCAMHKISRTEFTCATVNAKKESQVYRMLKKSRMEVESALITAGNDSKVFTMNKNVRTEVLKCAIMTVESERQICEIHKRVESSLNVQ